MTDEDPEIDPSDGQLDYEVTGEYASKIPQSYKLQSDDIYRAVKIYDDAQRLRLASKAKSRTKPNELTEWFDSWLHTGEDTIKPILARWAESPDAPAEAHWAFQQIGVGPVISAALSGYIDVTRAKTASSVWKLAGLAPGFDKKVKGTTIPYNEHLKVLSWKVGESFLKVMSKPDSFYGRLFVHYKDQEERDNEAGKHADAAANELGNKRITDPETKATLQSGKLTQGHLHSRAKRKTTKVFLTHYWQVGRQARGLEARPVYAATILGHDGIHFLNGPPDDQPVPVPVDLLRSTDIILARWQVRKAQVFLDELSLQPAEEMKAAEVANAEEVLEQAKESLVAAQKRANSSKTVKKIPL